MDIILAVLIAYALGASIWPHIVKDRRIFLIGVGALVLAMAMPLVTVVRLIEAAVFVLFMLAGTGESISQWRREIQG